MTEDVAARSEGSALTIPRLVREPPAAPEREPRDEDAALAPEETGLEPLPFGRALLVALGACFVVGLLESGKDQLFFALAGRERTIGESLRSHMPWWLLWMAVLPLVIALARRFRFIGAQWPRSAAVHASAAVLVSLAHGITFGLTIHHVVGFTYRPTLDAQVRLFLERYLFTDLLTYCAVIGIYWSVEYFTRFRSSALAAARAEARAARLQLRLADARIQALRMELNPHFLFNALNSVAGLVRKREPDAAVDMLARIGELLRTALDRDGRPEVTLAEEISLLRRYLDIELVRFGDRLRVVWEIDGEAWDACVPPLILQPLVENALRHGIARRAGVGLLHVAARRVGLQLELVVRDTGDGLAGSGGRPPREGIGLANTRARLEELYGAGHASVELEPASGGGALARVRLPYHLGRPGADAAVGS